MIIACWPKGDEQQAVIILKKIISGEYCAKNIPTYQIDDDDPAGLMPVWKYT